MKNDAQTLPKEFVDQLVGLYNKVKILKVFDQAQFLTKKYSYE